MKQINKCLIILTLIFPVYLSGCPAQTSNQAVNIKFDKEFLDKIGKATDAKGSTTPTASASPGSTTSPTTLKQWSATEISTFKDGCTTSAVNNNPSVSRQFVESYCSCAQAKVQEKYAYSETSQMPVAEFQSIIQTCNQQATGGQGSSTSAAWPAYGIEAFVQQCSQDVYVLYPYAQPNIVSSYCTCAQSKIAAKYSFTQLQSVTAADWQSASNTCAQQLLQ